MKHRTSTLAVACLLLLAPAASANVPALFIADTICDVDFPSCTGGIQGLRGARSVAISPGGAHVYLASSLDDALVVLSLGSKGELAFVQSLFDTDAGVDGLDSARGVAVSPDGEHVYVAALLDSSLAAFDRDVSTGMVSFIEVERDGVGGVDGLAGAHAVALSPDGRHVYVASRSEDALAVFSRDVPTGRVDFLEAHFDNLGGVDGLDAAEAVAVSPDGAHVYVAAETDGAVSVFARDTNSMSPGFGTLTFVEAHFDGAGGIDGLDGAGSVAVAPGGEHVYVGSERGAGAIEGDDWGAVFARNAATGGLTFVQGFDEADFGSGSSGIFQGCSGVGPDNSGVAVSPDGTLVYYTNPFRGTVATFDRHPVNGGLTLLASICDLNFGIDGIAGAVGITTTPGGERIVTASPSFEIVATLDGGIFVDGFESGNLAAWSSSVP